MERELKGISFPFRIGGRGGVSMSGKNGTVQQHLQENVMQLLGTLEFERVMNPSKGLEDLSIIFDTLDEASKNLAIFKITEFLALNEPRIEIVEIDIVTEKVGIDSYAHICKLRYIEVDTGQEAQVEQIVS